MQTIIFSGFLGAGKTTLIKKMITESFKNRKLVLIENEFGEIGVDGGFLKEAGVQINEINSGCICCSLVGDFTKALQEVLTTYSPEVLFIEPSGVGKLSDVLKAVQDVIKGDILSITVVDAVKCKMYAKNFGEFFSNQIIFADAIVLSHTQKANAQQLKNAQEIIRGLNQKASLVSADWDKINADQILLAIGGVNTVEQLIEGLIKEEHHHKHEHEEECHCGCHDHEHHHKHHDHEEGCTCGCHDHDHHADEVFTSFGKETTNRYTLEKIQEILAEFDEMSVGTVLRAKGIVESENGEWIHFDYVPDEINVRYGSSETIGKICVIGSDLDTEKIEKLFNL